MEFNLDTPLLELAGTTGEKHLWTARNAVEGVQIFGGIGSGKTSGSGRMLALKYLAAGFGGLVLTVKPEEKELWEKKYCTLTGRSDDLIIIEPERSNYFNFLEYESNKGFTENIVDVLKTVIRASEEKANGTADDPFWETALDMLIFNVIDLCRLAYRKVSLQQIYEIVQSLPSLERQGGNDAENPSAFYAACRAAKKNVDGQVDDWERNQSADRLLQLSDRASYEAAIMQEVPDARLLSFVDTFFMETFKNLSEKTRSIIDFSFSGFLFRLLRDPVYTLFCKNETNVTPELCGEGKIILINLPVKLYHKVGRDCQIMFKYIWQRAMEKRKVDKTTKPVFLWADEAQNFLHEHDTDYQATARSSRIATVYISQNLPNYHANMGGAKSEFKVKSFLGTLATKIFHANADIETNKYASELIGEGQREDVSQTTTAAGQFSSSQTKSYKDKRMVPPEKFALLKTGGDRNGGKVEAYIHVQGNDFGKGTAHAKTMFNQDYLTK